MFKNNQHLRTTGFEFETPQIQLDVQKKKPQNKKHLKLMGINVS